VRDVDTLDPGHEDAPSVVSTPTRDVPVVVDESVDDLRIHAPVQGREFQRAVLVVDSTADTTASQTAVSAGSNTASNVVDVLTRARPIGKTSRRPRGSSAGETLPAVTLPLTVAPPSSPMSSPRMKQPFTSPSERTSTSRLASIASFST
jgi:hypothetical protein